MRHVGLEFRRRDRTNSTQCPRGDWQDRAMKKCVPVHDRHVCHVIAFSSCAHEAHDGRGQRLGPVATKRLGHGCRQRGKLCSELQERRGQRHQRKVWSCKRWSRNPIDKRFYARIQKAAERWRRPSRKTTSVQPVPQFISLVSPGH